MTTVGESLIRLLEANGVEIVFGIPGVHTIELYRGLAASTIRHVTPRHEQGAAFMADGYARVSGKPGVAFVITGPGLTNTITAMAQARFTFGLLVEHAQIGVECEHPARLLGNHTLLGLRQTTLHFHNDAIARIAEAQ